MANQSTVSDIMSRNVVWVEPKTLVSDVAKKMREKDCGCILVGENEKLVGVITDRDIAIRCVAEGHDCSKTSAKEIMSPSVLYCRETDSCEDVAQNMAEAKVRRLLVLDSNKRMVGIVSLGDLARDAEETDTGAALGQICEQGVKKAA